MKKFLPYFLVVLLLATVAGWLFYKQLPSTIAKEESEFAVKDANAITSIKLTDTDKNTMELSLVKGVWIINGQFIAREDLVKELLDAVTRVTSLSPVPNKAHENVVREMLGKNTRVEIYCGSKKPTMVYYVGGPTVDSRGTYMLREVDGKMAARPHITYIPGFNGYLTPRYVPDVQNWRSRVLFDEPQDNVDELSVEYLMEPEKSFTIKRLGTDSFNVFPQDEKYRINENTQQRYIQQYLSFYRGVFVESYENENPEKDTVLSKSPFCIINISVKNGADKKVELYYMPVNKRSKKQFDDKGNPMLYDIDHYYATLNSGKDFAMVQYYTLGKLLRSYKDFYFKPAN
jgi:hypothetical protein